MFVYFFKYGQIIRNLIAYHLFDSVPNVSKIFHALAIFFTYPLQIYPVVTIIWTHRMAPLFPPEARPIFETSFRVMIVAITSNKTLYFTFVYDVS